jgi:hypothetical protein
MSRIRKAGQQVVAGMVLIGLSCAGVGTLMAAPTPKRLNNLVTELITVSEQRLGDGAMRHEFTNPRDGWVFVSCAAEVRQGERISISIDSDPRLKEVIVMEGGGPSVVEAMRLLGKGRHELFLRSEGGQQKIERLIVRAIPELGYATFPQGRRVPEFGAWKMDFLKKHIFRNVNCITSYANPSEHGEFMRSWKAQGKQWIDMHYGVQQVKTAEEAYTSLATSRAFTDPLMDGAIGNEFSGSKPYQVHWAKAIRRISGEARFKDKRYYAYCFGDPFDFAPGRELIRALTDTRSVIAWEVYVDEQADEAALKRHFEKKLVRGATEFEKQRPGSMARVLVVPMYSSVPPESVDTLPSVNFKVFLDIFLNVIATNPAFDGAYGFMPYQCNYVDEETARWTAMLMRHYFIEGNTTRLSTDPYRLNHVKNPDFDDGAKGWTLSPAETGSITPGHLPGFGWLQGRFPPGMTKGDHFLLMRRSKKRPNSFAQEIRNLEPGRLYSLRMYTADHADRSTKQSHAISINIEGAELIHEQSRSVSYLSCHSIEHKQAREDEPEWLNYHWRLFKAKGTTAKLTVYDWVDPDNPYRSGGPTGQTLAYNFVQIEPYLVPEGK